MKLRFEQTRGRNDQTLKEYLTGRDYCKPGGLYEDAVSYTHQAPEATIVVPSPAMLLAAQPGLPPSVVAPTQATRNVGEVQNM